MVEPLTTVAGLIPFTRTFGASEIAYSRIDVVHRGFAYVVRFAPVLGDDRVGRTHQHHASGEILLAQYFRGFLGQAMIRGDVHIQSEAPTGRR